MKKYKLFILPATRPEHKKKLLSALCLIEIQSNYQVEIERKLNFFFDRFNFDANITCNISTFRALHIYAQLTVKKNYCVESHALFFTVTSKKENVITGELFIHWRPSTYAASTTWIWNIIKEILGMRICRRNQCWKWIKKYYLIYIFFVHVLLVRLNSLWQYSCRGIQTG